MTEQELLDRLNADAPPFIGMLGGKVVAADPEANRWILPA